MDTDPSETVNPKLPSLLAAKPVRARSLSFPLLAAALITGLLARLFGPSWLKALFERAHFGGVRGATALLCALAVSMVVHESGHLVAAFLTDCEILGFLFGPCRAFRLYGKWSFERSGGLFGASVSAIPRDTRDWRRRMLMVVGAGPAATFLLGVASALIFLNLPGEGWAALFLGAMAQFSLLIVMLGLIPSSASQRTQNDAALFLSIWQRTAQADEMFTHHQALQIKIRGVRPRDCPEELIRKMSVAHGRPETAMLCAQIISAWAIDRGDLHSAYAWTQRAVELSLSCELPAQNRALAASACFDTLFRNDFPAAKAKLTDVELGLLSPPNFAHRVKAVSALLSGNVPVALAEIARSRFALPRRFPIYQFEYSLLSRLHQLAVDFRSPELTVRASNSCDAEKESRPSNRFRAA